MRPLPKILVIGDLPELQEALRQAGYEPVVDTDLESASARLTEEWFHLAIIHLPSADDERYGGRMRLAMQTGALVPKIILSGQPLDHISQTVRSVLTGLDGPSPSVAFVSQMEGMRTVVDTVGRAIRKHLGINGRLKILPGPEVFYDLAGWLKPGTDPVLWASELEDLFRILFQDCTSIRVEWREYLSRRRGEICTLWVQPASEIVPEGHPLLVKCGLREDIERARENYERFFFRITPTRLAGFARTTHFAAAALPAPAETHNIVGDFPAFYRRKSENEVCKAITLFTEVCKRWVQKVAVLPDLRKDMRALYLERLNLANRVEVGSVIQKLIERAPYYGLQVKQTGDEIGFQFRSREMPHFYPNPLLYLYGKRKGLELKPSRVCITHGNLRDENLCVDTEGIIWLDGYEDMDWGPAVTDAAALEAVLKFRCSEDTWSMYQLYQLERTALFPTHFDDILESPAHQPEEIQRLLRIVAYLRNTWAGVLSGTDLQEYYASLFFFTMRELVTEEASTESRLSEKRKLHALLSAAMICYRLEHWEDFALKGWPGPKHPLP